MDRTQDFIQKAKKIHGDKYDYSKVVYKTIRTRVIIICPEHGEFLQMPETHLKGKGCPECEKTSGKKLQEFIDKSKKIHGDKYDYSKSVYLGANEKIEIICPKHGSFFMRASAHYSQGQGCPICGREEGAKNRRNTNEEFIERAKFIHKDKYDYSQTRYVNLTTPIDIICPEHGVFKQTPRDHLDGCGCKVCGNKSKGYVVDTESFIKVSSKKHQNKYNYSKVNFNGRNGEVTIICPKHGEFTMKAFLHYEKGQGCPQCSKEKVIAANTLQFGEVVDICNDVHDGYYKYIYDKDAYINTSSEIEVLCPKHGIFSIQAFKHMHGIGCPICANDLTVSKGERKIAKILKDKNIEYILHANPKFLEKLTYDFYIPQYNLAIEYNGRQHYEPVDFFGGESQFNKQVKRDCRKKELSIQNNITLIEIKYDQEDNDLAKLQNLLDVKSESRGIELDT